MFISILKGHFNNKGIPLEASYSPDSQFIFSGSTDGRVHVWNADTGYKVRDRIFFIFSSLYKWLVSNFYKKN